MNKNVRGVFWANQLPKLLAVAIMVLATQLLFHSRVIAQVPLSLPKAIPGDSRPVLILGGIESQSQAAATNSDGVSLASASETESDDNAECHSPMLQKIMALIEENADLRSQLKIQKIQAEAHRRVTQLQTEMRITAEKLETSQRSLREAAIANEQLEKRVAELEHRSRLLQQRVRAQTEDHPLQTLPPEQQATPTVQRHDKSNSLPALRAIVEDLRRSIKKFRNSREELKHEDDLDDEEEDENEDQDDEDRNDDDEDEE